MDLTLKVAVLKSNKSQMQIAKEAEINPSELSRILNGWIIPKNDKIERLSKALGMSDKRMRSIFKKDAQKAIPVKQPVDIIERALKILEDRDTYAPTAARTHAAAVLREMTIEEYFAWQKEKENEDSNTN